MGGCTLGLAYMFVYLEIIGWIYSVIQLGYHMNEAIKHPLLLMLGVCILILWFVKLMIELSGLNKSNYKSLFRVGSFILYAAVIGVLTHWIYFCLNRVFYKHYAIGILGHFTYHSLHGWAVICTSWSMEDQQAK